MKINKVKSYQFSKHFLKPLQAPPDIVRLCACMYSSESAQGIKTKSNSWRFSRAFWGFQKLKTVIRKKENCSICKCSFPSFSHPILKPYAQTICKCHSKKENRTFWKNVENVFVVLYMYDNIKKFLEIIDIHNCFRIGSVDAIDKW